MQAVAQAGGPGHLLPGVPGLAHEGGRGVDHLLMGRDPRARHHDQEGSHVVARGGHRRNPAALAVTPQPGATTADSGLPGRDRDRRPRILRQRSEGRAGLATRGTFAAPLVNERRNPERGKKRRKMAEQRSFASATTRRMHRHHNGEPS
jgi:hypothetical protein